MQDVVERRGKVRKYNTDPEYKKQVDDDKRERAKAQRKADPPLSYRLPLSASQVCGLLQNIYSDR